MEMFSEVEWKKSNATTQELVCNCRSESVLRSVNERWISDSYGVRFGSTSSQNVCDDQMLQRILSYETFGELFLRSSLRNFYRNFLNEHSTKAFREHTQSPNYGPSASS